MWSWTLATYCTEMRRCRPSGLSSLVSLVESPSTWSPLPTFVLQGVRSSPCSQTSAVEPAGTELSAGYAPALEECSPAGDPYDAPVPVWGGGVEGTEVSTIRRAR